MDAEDWTEDRLAELSTAEELEIVITRAGRPTLRIPIWMVVVGGDLFVRSYKGVTSGWYRGVAADQRQSIVIDGSERPVLFEVVDRTAAVNTQIDVAYLSKYSRFDYRDAMVEPAAVDATLRILPR